MVKLRLMRMGKKKQPTYRVVAADSRKARNGRFIEIVGTYQPRLHPSVIKIDNAKAVKWLRQGAQPTERVEKLLRVSGAWDEFKGLPPGTSGTYQAPAGQSEVAGQTEEAGVIDAVDEAKPEPARPETPVAAAPTPAADAATGQPAEATPAADTTEGGE